MSGFKHNGDRVLLAEGKNDCFVIASLCSAHNVLENFGLYDSGSDAKALKRLSALIAGSEPLEVIGIVLDADNPNIQSKWASVKSRLTKLGYTMPSSPNLDGTIVSADDLPRVGIWLMPNNNIDGMLEDFCRTLASDSAIDFAQACALEAKEKGYASFKDVHLSKSTIHTFLAWQDEPGMPLGQAITSNALDSSKPTAIQFIDFLKRLYE